MYKLFYYPRNASWAPHMLLTEIELQLGAAFELVLVDRKANQQKSSDYLALNPTGRIPTLIDNQIVIYESAAICLYLCEQHPQAGLMPALGDPARAEFYQWLFYLNSSLQPELMLYFYPERHTSGSEADKIAAAQVVRITEMFALLDSALGDKQYLLGDKQYLLGDQLSLCDYFLFMLAHWASGFARPPLSFKHLNRYLRQLAQRPAVRKVCAVEGTDLKAYA